MKLAWLLTNTKRFSLWVCHETSGFAKAEQKGEKTVEMLSTSKSRLDISRNLNNKVRAFAFG